MTKFITNGFKQTGNAEVPNASLLSGKDGSWSDSLLNCCIRSATRHGPFNTMLACGDCKKVLKVFRETGALKKYLKFCASSERQVTTGVVGDYLVVAFSL